MRLPQIRSRNLSIRVAVFLALAATIPVGARAATQPLVFSPTILRFGDVTVGHSEAQFVVVTNTGSTTVKVSAIGVSGAEFKASSPTLPLVLSPGERVAVKVIFAPTAMGWAGSEATFTNSSPRPKAQLSLTGVGVKSEPITATPLSLSFGNVPVGGKVTHSVVLTNHRPWKETLKSIQTLGSGFTVSAPTTPVTLLPGKSITLHVSFAPQFAGLDGGSIFVVGMSSPSIDIPMSGTGTGATSVQLGAAPTSLNFGSVDLGAARKETFSIKAIGGTVKVSSVASSNSQFKLSGASFPLTIAAGQTQQLDVTFAPNKSGTFSGKLTLTSDASNSQSAEAVSGIGVVPPPLSVNLSWNADSPPVAGYNVYRGTTLGHYSKINKTLEANTAYTDATVVSGTTYYYAATAVNSQGEESAYSSPIKVVIP